MNQDCSTCRENGEEDCPDVAGKGCPEWVVHPMITIGRRAGIEQAAKVCYDASKLAHLGFVAEVCGERVEALLKGI